MSAKRIIVLSCLACAIACISLMLSIANAEMDYCWNCDRWIDLPAQGSPAWQFDAYEGWFVCGGCGGTLSHTHVVECQNPTRCLYCGHTTGEGIVIREDRIMHAYSIGDQEEIFYDAEHCWHKCIYCEQPCYIQEHVDDCTERGKCIYCGHTVKANGIKIGYSLPHSGHYEHDEIYCWIVCDTCGEELDKQEHILNCRTGTCWNCNTPESAGITFSDRVHTFEYEYDAESHHGTCICGYVLQGYHWGFCVEPDLCVTCGHTTSEGIIIHEILHLDFIGGNYSFDTNYCWCVCNVCGETTEKYEHSASCLSPDTCVNCSHTTAEGININSIQHNYEWVQIGENAWDLKLSYDDTYHWYKCIDCGEETFKQKHYALCTDSSHCADCGYSFPDGTDVSIEHLAVGCHYEYSTTHHWLKCDSCGAEGSPGSASYESHSDEDNDGKCDICEAVMSDGRVAGDANGDNVLDGRDLLRLAKYLGGYSVEMDMTSADVTGDGLVDGRDLLRLAKFLGGYNVVLV